MGHPSVLSFLLTYLCFVLEPMQQDRKSKGTVSSYDILINLMRYPVGHKYNKAPITTL